MTLRSARSFTLIELMAVLMIIGILMLAVVPGLDDMVPAYRLTAAGRSLASNIDLAQSEAIGRRADVVIVYDLDANSYWLVVPGLEDSEEGEEEEEEEEAASSEASESGLTARPSDDIEHGSPSEAEAVSAEEGEEEEAEDDAENVLPPSELPLDVVFELVVVGEAESSSGKVRVTLSALGNRGAHSVGLKLKDDGGQVWVKFNPLTRTVEYSEERPEARTLEGDDDS